MEHSIEAGERKYLEVHVAGRKQPKRVPLAACLPVPRIVELGDIEAMVDTPEAQAASMRWFYALFREYVGADIDRLTADKGNEIEVQSVGVQTLGNILRSLEDLGIFPGTWTAQVFNQRFLDECAGVFASVRLEVPTGWICPEEFE